MKAFAIAHIGAAVLFHYIETGGTLPDHPTPALGYSENVRRSAY
jgi:hypothetical protein